MSSNLAFAARHSMDSPEWYTPVPFVEAAREVMGVINLDPATHVDANAIVQAECYFTADDDGLKQTWQGNVFLNPPGGLVNEFWKHLLSQHQVTQAIWIGYSLEQLQTLQLSGAPLTPLDFSMCVPNRRIAFVENEAKRTARIAKLTAQGKKPNQKSQPSHANYITYIGPERERFSEVFSLFGKVVIR